MLQPVLHIKPRNITEMTDIAGHEYPAIGERGGRYLEISRGHRLARSFALGPYPTGYAGGIVVKGKHLDSWKDKLLEERYETLWFGISIRSMEHFHHGHR